MPIDPGPTSPPPDPGPRPDPFEGLGQRLLDFGSEAVRYVRLVVDTNVFRLRIAFRQIVFSLVVGVAAIIATVVGYIALAHETAHWLARISAWDEPGPIRILVYLLFTAAPFTFMKLRQIQHEKAALAELEHTHASHERESGPP